MNYHETNLNWINFGQNLNIELNQFRYRTGLPLSPRPAMPIPQTHTWNPLLLLHDLQPLVVLPKFPLQIKFFFLPFPSSYCSETAHSETTNTICTDMYKICDGQWSSTCFINTTELNVHLNQPILTVTIMRHIAEFSYYYLWCTQIIINKIFSCL